MMATAATSEWRMQAVSGQRVVQTPAYGPESQQISEATQRAYDVRVRSLDLPDDADDRSYVPVPPKQSFTITVRCKLTGRGEPHAYRSK